jgi:hypothetical protein
MNVVRLVIAVMVLCGVAYVPLFAQMTHAQENTFSEAVEQYDYPKTGLVPCGNEITVDQTSHPGKICYVGECTVCHAHILTRNIVAWLTVFAILFAGLRFVYVAGLLLFIAFIPNALTRAGKIFRRTVIGLLMVLSAWLVVDLFMRTFLADDSTGLGPWDEFLCKNAGEEGEVRCFDKITPRDLSLKETPIETDCVKIGGQCARESGLLGQTTCASVGKEVYAVGTGCGEGVECCVGSNWRHPQNVSPPGQSYCEKGYLRGIGFPESSIAMAECICMLESSGGKNPALPSSCDVCTGPGKYPVAFGIWQINLSVHDLGGIDCTSTIQPPYGTCSSSNPCKCRKCTVPANKLEDYNKCVALASDAEVNMIYALQLFTNSGGTWGNWSYSYNKCLKMGVK